jgi:hypothetical protein
MKYIEPNFDREWDEAQRYPKLKRLGKDGWINLAKKGRIGDVDRKSSTTIGNLSSAKDWDTLEAPKRQRFLDAYKKKEMEMPIIMNRRKKLELLAGNTRLSGMLKNKGKSKAWFYDV